MTRPSRLMYSPDRTDLRQSQSDIGEMLGFSDLGVPILWFFAFGGRNIWTPGDRVSDRGGAVGKRNPYETPVEVALTRLEHVEAALADSPYIWPWLSAMPILRRKIEVCQKTGYLRVVAPWVIGLKELQINRWTAATAFAENAVNLLSAGRRTEGIRALRELAPFCPYVPDGDLSDRIQFDKLSAHKDEPFHKRVLYLTMGKPGDRNPLEPHIEKTIVPAFARYEKLTPIDPVPGQKETVRLPSGKTTDSFLGRLTRMIGGRGKG